MPGAIGRVAGARKAGPAERALRDAAPFVPTEDDAHPLQIQDVAGRLPAHCLDGVLVAQIQAPLRGVEGVGLPGVILAQRRVDPSLRGDGMTADRMDFREEGHVQMGGRRQGGPHAGQTGADDEEIVHSHATMRLRMTPWFGPSARVPVQPSLRRGPS